jgi:F-type H+-transporting ATPase subunit c
MRKALMTLEHRGPCSPLPPAFAAGDPATSPPSWPPLPRPSPPPSGVSAWVWHQGACECTARNPRGIGKITVTLILGLAFLESLAIYAWSINLICCSPTRTWLSLPQHLWKEAWRMPGLLF